MTRGCPKCGRMLNEVTTICPYCHYNFSGIDDFFKKTNEKIFIENEKYAGFIKRLVAGLFDIFLTLIFTYFILIAVDKYLIKITLDNLYIGLIIFIPLYILYNSICERTSWRGSLGKYILNIEVTDQYENPVTFPKALGRNTAKILNILTLGIGFLLSALPPQKQALNDKVAHTFVINKIVMKEKYNMLFASPIKRFAAFIIDALIISLICYGIFALANLIPTKELSEEMIDTLECAKYIVCLVVILFYFPFAESKTGSTFGKSFMHIKVVKLSGDIPGFIISFARELILFLDIITLGFLLTFVTEKKQTIKDILTRTTVIIR